MTLYNVEVVQQRVQPLLCHRPSSPEAVNQCRGQSVQLNLLLTGLTVLMSEATV